MLLQMLTAEAAIRLEFSADPAIPYWQSVHESWASGGNYLKAPIGHYGVESAPQSFHLTESGRYFVAVRYWEEQGKRSNFVVLIRNCAQELIHVEKVDWNKIIPSHKPYETEGYPSSSGPVWQVFSFLAETPGDYRISIQPLIYRGKAASRRVDCVLIDKHELSGLAGMTPAQIATIPTAPAATATFTLPHTDLYAGTAGAAAFPLGMINCGSIAADPAAMVYLGFNRDHGTTFYRQSPLFHQSGIKTMFDPFLTPFPELIKKFPSPQGRFVNANGEVGNTFSLHFDEYWDELNRLAIPRIKEWAASGDADQLSISGEWGGNYDYSEPALKKFRLFLTERYGKIEQLNRVWKTRFLSWTEVRPPKTPEENPTAYYDFQAFSGQAFARLLARRAATIRAHAPHIPYTSQLSDLNIFSATFKRMNPMDYEEVIRTAFQGKGIFGWDGYCADDYMGAEVEYLDSMAGGLPMINHETNVHTENPDVLARTCWTMIGKGVKGIYLFMFEEGVFHDSYPKWAFLNGDFSHKAKLAAAADLAHEVRHLEPMLQSARRCWGVKPVYVYFSREDYLFQRSLISSWGEGTNSPYRVYELLRAAGYPVRYVTAAQINRGQLAEAGALVLSQSEWIPAETAGIIAAWINNGGTAIADTLPGIKDRSGKTNLTLMRRFGVEPPPPTGKKNGGSQLALQESSQGYGEVTIDAIETKDVPSSVFELWQQYDSQHPMLQNVAPFTFSGYGRRKVKCVGGEVVGMTFDGWPGLVANTPGKGHTLYLAGMLGSVYGGACSRYEFDDAHAGNAPVRLLSGFLRWAGLPPQTEISRLPAKVAAKVRIENPLVDERGNVMIGFASFNDQRLNDFEVRLRWPEKLARPAHFFAFANGSRELKKIQVNFTGNLLGFTMPGFSTYGGVIGLQNFGPLISLKADGGGNGSLPRVGVRGKLHFTATIYNASNRPLAPGTAELTLLPGWQADRMKFAVGQLAPWESCSLSFAVTAPDACALCRARPVSLRFRNAATQSTPATAIVWFE